MADESVFTHHDAQRLILAGACDYVNIKFAKTTEALRVNEFVRRMFKADGRHARSRLALLPLRVSLSQNNIHFYDMDSTPGRPRAGWCSV